MTAPFDLDPTRLRRGHGAKWGAVAADVTPAWVADMDLGVPGPVLERLHQTLARQDLGYPWWPDGDPVVGAFETRMSERHGWEPLPGRTRVLSDLIQVLQIVIEQTTAPGEGVALHVPTYPPFLAAIRRAGRTVVPLDLLDTPHGWALDLDHHREQVRRHRPRLLVVVNPHNPTGRVLTEHDLRGLADLADEYDLPVLADEIHADLVHAPHRHRPLAALDDATAARTITATSATKAFNLAGLRCAVVHVGHRPTAEALGTAPPDYFGTPSVLSRIATVAAWREADSWHADLLERLRANRDRVVAWAKDHADLAHHRPEATYLSWLDFGATAIADGPAARVVERGRVQLSPGAEFSEHTATDTTAYARLNFATTPAVLETILSGIDRALAG